MQIITISREFGSGGRELGKYLSDILGYDYYDSVIISAVAEKSGFDINDIEKIVDNYNWKSQVPVLLGQRTSSIYNQSVKVNLLLDEKKIIEKIASLGRNCVIVGRNGDLILEKYHPFNIFVCADISAKLQRCKERMSTEEKLSDKEILKKMKQVDKSRSQTREIMSAVPWGSRDAYHLTVNTTDWNIKDLALSVANFATDWFGREK